MPSPRALFLLSCLIALSAASTDVATVSGGDDGAMRSACRAERDPATYYAVIKTEGPDYCWCFSMDVDPAALLPDWPANESNIWKRTRYACSAEYLAAKKECALERPPWKESERVAGKEYRAGSWLLEQIDGRPGWFRYDWKGQQCLRDYDDDI